MINFIIIMNFLSDLAKFGKKIYRFRDHRYKKRLNIFIGVHGLDYFIVSIGGLKYAEKGITFHLNQYTRNQQSLTEKLLMTGR